MNKEEHVIRFYTCDYCNKLHLTYKEADYCCRCKNCGKEVVIDMEGDLVHVHLEDKGVDDRMCFPSNPDSKIAEK